MSKSWNASFLEALRIWGTLSQEGSAWHLILSDPGEWPRLAVFLRDHGLIDTLLLLTATHQDSTYHLRYDLRSLPHLSDFIVSFQVAEIVPSVSYVWPAANWHEREAYDLIGVRFDHHPDLRRILLPEDWIGHPLRKDYHFPESYHGISLEFTPPPNP